MRPVYLLLLLLPLIGCEPEPEITYGTCPFPPADSKFPAIGHGFYEECYFTLQFKGKEYAFEADQLDATSYQIDWNPPTEINSIQLIKNALLAFHFVAPPSVDLLHNSQGLRTPLLSLDSLGKLNSNAQAPASVAFGLYNYCNEFFEAEADPNKSYHQLTNVELKDSYPTLIGIDETDMKPYQLSFFFCTGELQATFNIYGETQVVTAEYKLFVEILEAL